MADPAEDDTEEGGAPASTPAAAPTDVSSSARAPVPGPDFTSMVKAPGDTAELQGKLAEIQRGKSAANAANADETIKRLGTDRARMEAAYKASATMPEELQSGWDAKTKMAEHSTDPVTAFGSVGSVFAMLASSFAGLPMEHALNAGAAAISAVHAGDEKAYQKEYESWKANTDLAVKRHEIQHQAYNDATNLMNSNINAGRTKMELAATRFGDQKAQALLDAGMDKELFELIHSRNKAALDMQSQWDQVQLQHEKVQDLRSREGYNDPARRGAVVQQWNQDWAAGGRQSLKYDFAKDYIDQQKKANPNYTPDDLAKWGKEAANAQEADDTKGAKGANTDLTEDRQKAALIAKLRDEKVAAGTPVLQATQEAKQEAEKAYPPKMTSAQQGKYQDRAFMADQTLQTIEKQLDRLQKYVGITGTAGYVSRAGEKVANIAGSTAVERQEFAKDIELMRLNASRMLTLSQGRPLAAEAARINAIIKGNSFGDLNAPTIAALRDYEKFVQDFKKDAESRLSGGANPEGGGTNGAGGTGGASGATKSKKAPWLNDPVVGPGDRSEVESGISYG